MPGPVVTLYSRSAPIIKATSAALAEIGILIRVNHASPPPTASFVVSNRAETREMVVMGHRLRAYGVVTLPAGALFLSSSARTHGGCILVGSDHSVPDITTPTEGALF